MEWLLVGLGNPGSKYESTRHNMGWLALDSLLDKEKFALNKPVSYTHLDVYKRQPERTAYGASFAARTASHDGRCDPDTRLSLIHI